MPIPFLVWAAGAAAAAAAAALVKKASDDAAVKKRRAAVAAQRGAERSVRADRERSERAHRRERFRAWRRDEVVRFAREHVLAVDMERLEGGSVSSERLRKLLDEAIDEKLRAMKQNSPLQANRVRCRSQLDRIDKLLGRTM